MKLEIGHSAASPLLSVKLELETLEELRSRVGFNDLYGKLQQSTDIHINRESEVESYALLAKKIGRRPAASNESFLKPFVRLLEWGCIAQGKPNHFLAPFRLDDIEAVPALDGSYRVESAFYWPSKKDKLVSELATTAMQSFGRQLRYGSYRRPGINDREVYVALDRIPPKDEDEYEFRQLTIHTATDLKSNLRVNNEMRDNGRWVEVGGNCIRSHKEQMIHLVGAIAVAHADGIELD